ncbi:Serine/threonine-protein kinase/endoribonuclease IRE1b [Linum grandiflorum]
MDHPLFWTLEKRLTFLQDVRDQIKLEGRECESNLLNALESIGTTIFDWNSDKKMKPALLNNIRYYRQYKFGGACDLLRVIHTSHHYMELPKEI